MRPELNHPSVVHRRIILNPPALPDPQRTRPNKMVRIILADAQHPIIINHVTRMWRYALQSLKPRRVIEKHIKRITWIRHGLRQTQPPHIRPLQHKLIKPLNPVPNPIGAPLRPAILKPPPCARPQQPSAQK